MNNIKPGKFIGARIKQRRREMRMSQEKLAEALNVSYQQVQRYENGTNLLNTEKLQIIAKFLNVPLSYFFDEHRIKLSGRERGHLPSEEMKYLRLFKGLDGTYKKVLLQLMRLAAKKK